MSGRSLKFPNELKFRWAVYKNFRTGRNCVGQGKKVFAREENLFCGVKNELRIHYEWQTLYSSPKIPPKKCKGIICKMDFQW